MKILIVAAMDDEVQEIREHYNNHSEVDVFVSGVAFTNASSLCGEIKKEHTHIINVGVAGSLVENIEIGKVFSCTASVQHDIDITLFGYKKGATGGGYINESILSVPQLPTCTIASGSKFVSDIDERVDINGYTDATLVDMETVVYARVCRSMKKDFYSIRSVSDSFAKGIELEYDTNVEIAFKTSQAEAIKFIDGLLNE